MLAKPKEKNWPRRLFAEICIRNQKLRSKTPAHNIFLFFFLYFELLGILCSAADDGVVASELVIDSPVRSCIVFIAEVTGVVAPLGAGVVLRDAGALLLWAI